MPIDIKEYDTETGKETGETQKLDKASASDARLPGSTENSEYPWNSSYISRSGHEFKFDDTPGAETVRLAHKSGTYFEVSEDGRKVELVSGNEHKYGKGGLTLTIDKNGDIKIGGNLRLVVSGDAHIETKGNITATVGGSLIAAVNQNLEAHVKQDAIVAVGRDMTTTVVGNMTAGIGKDMAAVVAGNMTTAVEGESFEVVNGNKTTVVSGKYEIKAGSIDQTSDEDFKLTSGGNMLANSGARINIKSRNNMNLISGNTTTMKVKKDYIVVIGDS